MSNQRLLIRKAAILLCIALFQGVLLAQQPAFQPATHQVKDITLLFNKIDTRLSRDIAAIPGSLPKNQKAAIIQEYTERRDSVKSDLNAGGFLMDTLWGNWFQYMLAEIGRGNPDVPVSEINLFVGRGGEPNAWCVGEGSIVFNIGLLPFLENESEAAAILCHEVAHYIARHGNLAIEKYATTMYSKETQKELKYISRTRVNRTERVKRLMQGMTYNSRRHSRFKEADADSIGFVLLSNTKYASRASFDALTRLDSIDRFTWEPIAYKKLLDASQFPFQDAWLIEPPKSALALQGESMDDDDAEIDSLKTHPDCQQRRALIARQMGDRESTGSAFLQNEARFKQLKQLSDYEVVEALYDYRKYGRCLFQTLVLRQQNPDDIYLQAMVVKCLYYIHHFQKEHALRRVLDSPRPGFSKEYKSFLQFVNQLRLNDIANMGYGLCEDHLIKHPENEDALFAAALASDMKQQADVFETRKNLYLQRYPNGRFVNTLNNIKN